MKAVSEEGKAVYQLIRSSLFMVDYGFKGILSLNGTE